MTDTRVGWRRARAAVRGGWLAWLLAGAAAAQAGAPDAAPAEVAGTEGRSGGADAFFVQRGTGEEVESFTIGLVRGLQVPWLGPRTGVYAELSLSQWEARPRAPRDTGRLVQIGLKPTLRHTLILGQVATFAEVGIGLTLSSEVYRKRERQFSTTFNFGDHLALGWAFGARHAHEIVLRVEHFSNADMVQPNPGENFRELRYVHWF